MVSRRTYNETLWVYRVEKGQDLTKLVHEQANERYRCKEITARSDSNSNIAEMFLVKSNSITLSVPQNIEIATNDLVKFRDVFWRVSGVQKRRDLSDTQYRTRGDYLTYLQLVGAKL